MIGQPDSPSPRLAVCVRNDGAEDLVVRRIYTVLIDSGAEARGFVRVIDESDEDYLYPASYFVEVHLAPDLEQALLATI